MSFDELAEHRVRDASCRLRRRGFVSRDVAADVVRESRCWVERFVTDNSGSPDRVNERVDLAG